MRHSCGGGDDNIIVYLDDIIVCGCERLFHGIVMVGMITVFVTVMATMDNIIMMVVFIPKKKIKIMMMAAKMIVVIERQYFLIIAILR